MSRWVCLKDHPAEWYYLVFGFTGVRVLSFTVLRFRELGITRKGVRALGVIVKGVGELGVSTKGVIELGQSKGVTVKDVRALGVTVNILTFFPPSTVCIVPMEFLPWEIWFAFPKESQLQQSCATQLTVHAGCFSVSIIH